MRIRVTAAQFKAHWTAGLKNCQTCNHETNNDETFVANFRGRHIPQNHARWMEWRYREIISTLHFRSGIIHRLFTTSVITLVTLAGLLEYSHSTSFSRLLCTSFHKIPSSPLLCHRTLLYLSTLHIHESKLSAGTPENKKRWLRKKKGKKKRGENGHCWLAATAEWTWIILLLQKKFEAWNSDRSQVDGFDLLLVFQIKSNGEAIDTVWSSVHCKVTLLGQLEGVNVKKCASKRQIS